MTKTSHLRARRPHERAQAHVGVVLSRLGDRPLRLTQRELGGVGRLGQRPPSAPTRKSWDSWPSGNAAASHELHTTPPAAAENPCRWSDSPQPAHDPSWGTIPAASRSLRRKASPVAGRAFAGSRSSSASSLASRRNTSGWGSGVSNSRATASQARAAASSVAACSRSAGWGATVSTPVTVCRSLRPSWRITRMWKNGSSRAPNRLRARRAPLAMADTRP